MDNKSAGRQSIASNLMKPDDEVDDGDSMAAYGEGDTGKINLNKPIAINQLCYTNSSHLTHSSCSQAIIQILLDLHFTVSPAIPFIFFVSLSNVIFYFANWIKGMNEDGSFIGQYGRKGRGQESNSQAFATLV